MWGLELELDKSHAGRRVRKQSKHGRCLENECGHGRSSCIGMGHILATTHCGTHKLADVHPPAPPIALGLV